jgi:hypothetical protein
LYACHLFHPCYLTCPSHPLCFDHPSNIWWRIQVIKLLIMQSSPATSSLIQIFSSAPCSQTPSTYDLPLVWGTKFYTHTKTTSKILVLNVFRGAMERQNS